LKVCASQNYFSANLKLINTLPPFWPSQWKIHKFAITMSKSGISDPAMLWLSEDFNQKSQFSNLQSQTT